MPPGGPLPLAAVRADLRGALAELCGEILEHEGTDRLVDAVRHAWMLAYLAEVGEGPVRHLLRELLRDLRSPDPLDTARYVPELTRLADELRR